MPEPDGRGSTGGHLGYEEGLGTEKITHAHNSSAAEGGCASGIPTGRFVGGRWARGAERDVDLRLDPPVSPLAVEDEEVALGAVDAQVLPGDGAVRVCR
jgi:hypothetical protein